MESLVLPFTGERFTPEVAGDIELEHLHRYIMAQRFASNKTVLDIASGEGYGSSLLANVAKHVIGVDLSEDAVDHASRKYRKGNLEFKVGDCAKIPLQDNSVDLVVSYETIEHHDQHEAMMDEIKRVLNPGGVVIISSPDKHEFSDVPNYRNPFHVKELYRQDFEKLMATHFKHVALFGQRVVYGSGLFLENIPGDFVSYNAADAYNSYHYSCPGVWRPLYLIAIASDENLPAITSSFFDQPIVESNIVRSWVSIATDRDAQIINLSKAISERDEHIANLSQVIAARESEAADLRQHTTNLSQVIAARESEAANFQKSLAEREEQIRIFQGIAERAEFLEGQLKDAKIKIDEFLSSTSWRITEPLRTLRGCLRKKRRPDRFVCSDQLVVSEAVPQNTEAEEQHNNLLLDSSDFDAEFYHKAYPDTHGLDPYYHYSNFGKNEGRLPCAPAPVVIEELKKLDRSRETVLIVSHEASRTGAPILALNIAQHLKEKKYNVIVFLLRGGDLLADFQEHCDIVVEPFPQSHNAYVVSIVLEQLISQAGLKFAIVNSIVSRSVLPALSNCFVPSLCLVHEFASYTYPKTAIRDVVLWANQVVFSARIVYENNATECDVLDKYNPVILPQGKCVVPHAKDTKEVDEKEKKRIRKLFRPDTHDDNTIVILGAGFVQLRKGVDLFLTCAARVAALCPQNSFRFIWVGQGFDPDLDLVYSAYLQDQINRAGLENRVCFTGEISDIDLAYELSDVLFLSSRLDPLPNVAIDAMFQQLPVICFDNTTGIADLLKANGLGEACVIPYLDVEQAAQRLFSLIEDADQRIRLGKDINEVGRKLFDMRTYVDSLESQAMDCLATQEIEKSDCAVIEEDETLDLDFFSSAAWSALSYTKAVRAFVRTWKSGIDMRKPFPGFHPGIYEDLHGVPQTGSNPLVAFIQAGKPEGPWLCDLIQPSPPVQMGSKQPLRAALHIHVFFVDLFLDILQRLEGQNLHLDLLISVPSSKVAEEVGVLASGYTYGIVDIQTVPNRGRDIGPFLTQFNETILKNYDVIGHVHTKKSGDLKESATGETWFKFLLENLIGNKYPMASLILERFAGNEKLGLVFPDDPHVIGWSGNKLIAENLAHQFEINELPDLYFNFPVGTMFWAKTEALKPLLAKNFSWEDYPEEPLPYDGTILHSLERLLPFVAKKMGYHMSLTHVPCITR